VTITPKPTALAVLIGLAMTTVGLALLPAVAARHQQHSHLQPGDHRI
jgi:hypothetical protein